MPAEPRDFYDWFAVHTGASRAALLRCGWSFRGVFAASASAVRRHPPAYYAHLEAQLGAAVFPVAGMYMERLWRYALRCAPRTPPGGPMPWEAWEAGQGARDAAALRET